MSKKEKKNVCEKCEPARSFSRRSNLLRHDREVHGTATSYACAVCKRRFKRKYDLQEHEKAVHSKEKPFSCDVCGQRFARSNMVLIHKAYKHDGDEQREHACSCGKRFVRKFELDRHVGTCSGGKLKAESNGAANTLVRDAGEKTQTSHPASSLLPRALLSDLMVRHEDHIDALVDGHVVCFDGGVPLHLARVASECKPDCAEAGAAEAVHTHEEDNHSHNEECGHISFLHDDHSDYLVGNHLHAQQKDGSCVNHGHLEVYRRQDLESTFRSESSLRSDNVEFWRELLNNHTFDFLDNNGNGPEMRISFDPAERSAFGRVLGNGRRGPACHC